MADRNAWLTGILDRYERPLVRYALRRVGNLETARDTVQECFLRLCRERPPPEGTHLTPWLYRVCRNLTVDHLRKNGRVRPLENVAEMPSLQRGPQRRAQLGDDRVRLASLVEGLPPRQREVVRLRFQDGLSYREISEVTGAGVSHVGVLLHGAMQTLRRQMSGRSHSGACEGSSR